jgi:hypothetical protein
MRTRPVLAKMAADACQEMIANAIEESVSRMRNCVLSPEKIVQNAQKTLFVPNLVRN